MNQTARESLLSRWMKQRGADSLPMEVFFSAAVLVIAKLILRRKKNGQEKSIDFRG